MIDTLLNPSFFWRAATHLGSWALLLPLFAGQFVALWSSQPAAARRWLVALGLTVSATAVSKCLFWGWGIGSAALDFTGISGHAMLATAILPVFLCVCMPAHAGRLRHWGTGLGLLLALGVGLSRVVLDAHSVSEVVAGWLAGLAVVAVTLRALDGAVRPARLAGLCTLAVLLVLGTATARKVSTHHLEIRLALKLSGRSTPFLREQLQAPEQMSRLGGVVPAACPAPCRPPAARPGTATRS